MEHMRISGNEHSSMILMVVSKDENDCPKVPKHAVPKGCCNKPPKITILINFDTEDFDALNLNLLLSYNAFLKRSCNIF